MLEFPEIPQGSILGINYSGMHDTAVAIVAETGEMLFGCALERISRNKQDGGPLDALIEGVPWDRIRCVAVSTDAKPGDDAESAAEIDVHKITLPSRRKQGLVHGEGFYQHLAAIPGEKEYVCHQLSHAASTFWPSGMQEATCLTYDGGMSNCSWFGGVFEASRSQGIAPLARFNAETHCKITTVYTAITALLGFTPNKHEGKITGLAAFGKPNAACRDLLDRLFREEYSTLENLVEWHFVYSDVQQPSLVTNEFRRQVLLDRFAKFSREEIAATLQAYTEDHIVDILQAADSAGMLKPQICLAGGLFANVKVNQRIAEFGFKSVFVAPPMTDDGTALGAALHVASRGERFQSSPLRHVYLGPAYSRESVRRATEAFSLETRVEPDPARFIAARLAEGAIVGLYQGNMEFGPRALGNRSIIAEATDARINDSLNRKLHRTEFMPFAPIVASESFAECFKNFAVARHAAEFMTMTFVCKERLSSKCPAVVHVDNTARPQLVDKKVNSFLHAVLVNYRELTGNPALINTSFNIHEEPIVCTPEDAIRGFLESGLDFLYLDDGLIVESATNNLAALKVLREAVGRKGGSEGRYRQLLAEYSRRLDFLGNEVAAKEREIGALKTACDERRDEVAAKEHEIGELKTACDERQSAISALKTVCDERQSAISALKEDSDSKVAEIEQLLEVCDLRAAEISALEKECQDKEAVIQEMKAALDGLRRRYRIFMRLGALPAALKQLPVKMRSSLKPRLGTLYQYPPRPVHYERFSKPADGPLKISIVTPSYQQGHFIEDSIRSVTEQTYTNWEYFVQDGGSSDTTLEVLRRHEQRIHGWASEPDSGQTQAINRGFAHTSGDIMCWLNSDDLLAPDAFAVVADFFSRHPEVDVVYGHRILVDENGYEVGRWVLPRHSDAILSWADFVPQETLFWRRSIWEKAGGSLDESFRFAMDWDFLVRLRDTGARFVRLPVFLGVFRVHAQQKTSAAINEIGFAEMTRIRERSLGRIPDHIEINKAVASYMAQHVLQDFLYRLRKALF